jgi:short-subunit dehydrogenase
MPKDGIAGALVTGATRGIGRALALELAGRGVRVGLLARSASELDEVAGACRAQGGDGRGFAADVLDPAALAGAVDGAARWCGRLDLAVVNAGIGVHGAAAELPLEQVRRVALVNFVGAVASTTAALPHLLAAAPSAVVAVSSLSALIPYRGGGAYGGSKAALIAWLRCLRLELAGRNVRVGWLCPGPVRTDMIIDGVPVAKLPRLARWLVPVLTPERVAADVLWVARSGGQRVVPPIAAFFASLARHAPGLGERLLRLTGAGLA